MLINELPHELLDIIFIKVGYKWQQILMCVCRRWYHINLAWRERNNKQLIRKTSLSIAVYNVNMFVKLQIFVIVIADS